MITKLSQIGCVNQFIHELNRKCVRSILISFFSDTTHINLMVQINGSKTTFFPVKYANDTWKILVCITS